MTRHFQVWKRGEIIGVIVGRCFVNGLAKHSTFAPYLVLVCFLVRGSIMGQGPLLRCLLLLLLLLLMLLLLLLLRLGERLYYTVVLLRLFL